MDDFETELIPIPPITCDIKSFFARILFSTYYIKVFTHFYLSLAILFWYLGIKHSHPTSILLSSSLPPSSVSTTETGKNQSSLRMSPLIDYPIPNGQL